LKWFKVIDFSDLKLESQAKETPTESPRCQNIMVRILYLHGFASSPASRKASFFKEQLSQHGIDLTAPDLAEGDFRHLTITRQLEAADRAAGAGPVFLIGSSMGGYLAALYAARHPAVKGLILLAPAFHFREHWVEIMGTDRFTRWRETGETMVFHYGENREVPLSFELMEDAEKYEACPKFGQPCLIFHGTADTVVPVQYSEDFAAQHPNVELVTLQSGHEMTDVLGNIWVKAWPYLAQAIGR
jgi:pimeloyl-ACP methyl ester carboxylesterase